MEQVRFTIDKGEGQIFIETDDLPGGAVQRASRGQDQVAEANSTFVEALAMLKPTTQALLASMKDLAPQEIAVEFGFKVSYEGNIVIVKGTAEANFQVTLTWKKPEPK